MFELLLLSPQDRVDLVSDALMDEWDALAVSIEDADADTTAEQALFGEPGMPPPPGGWQRSVIKALFNSEPEATGAATLLLAQPWAAGIRLGSITAVPDEDWVRLTQAQFAPVPITPGFWIVPSWHAAPEGAERMIRLDPGLAFGTGTHATTRMCLRWIAHHAAASSARWTRVLDYGCGSGILAIAAALYGARNVRGVDIDPAAIEATRANALANGTAVSTGLPDTVEGTYPLLLANILAAPLKLMAPLLCSHLEPGGSLVLAGILDRQAAELAAAFAPWLKLGVADTDDGWILMTGVRAG